MQTITEYIEEFYTHQDNYKVVDQPTVDEPDLCVIYFSSVGLFSNKNYAERLDNDYYEFHRNPVKRAGRLIYVRDVTLTFYQDGISAKINTVDKLLDLLKELTKGYRVVTIGISGGGYMAMLVGALLKADYAISESGMVNLEFERGYFEQQPWQRPHSLEEKRRSPYWHIVEFLQHNPVTIYQFEAYRFEGDRANAALLALVPTAKFFNIDCAAHGSVLDSAAIGAFINLDKAQIEKLHQQTKGRVVSRGWFNFRVLPIGRFIALYAKKLRKNLLKIKFSRKEKLIVILGIPLINTTTNKQN